MRAITRHLIGGLLALGMAQSASAVNVWTDTAYMAWHDTAGTTEQSIDVTVDWSHENYFAVWHQDHAAIGLMSDGVPVVGYSGYGLGVAFGALGVCGTDSSRIYFAVEDYYSTGLSACSSLPRDQSFPQKKLRIVASVFNFVPGKWTVHYQVMDPVSGAVLTSGSNRFSSYYNGSNNRDIWIANTGSITPCNPSTMGYDCATYVGWTIHSVVSQ